MKKSKAPKTWATLRRYSHKGDLAKRFSHWIQKGIQKDGVAFTFKMEEIMAANGMDFNDKNDYQRAMGYFIEQRKAIHKAMKLFWKSRKYHQFVKDGLTNEQMFEKLIRAAVSWNIYPMYADPYDQYTYKLFDFDSYLQLKERRAHAIITETERVSDELATAKEALPQIEARYAKPQLSGGDNFVGLPSAKNDCPYTGCKESFSDQEDLVNHIEEIHLEHQKILLCPICISGGLKQMERGDYKCTECKQVIDKNNMDKSLKDK